MNYSLSLSPVLLLLAGLFYVSIAWMVIYKPFRLWVKNAFSLLKPSTNEEWAALDTYRGLAALLVVFAHYVQWATPVFDLTQDFMGFIKWGSKAVPIFVTLSGFLIYRSVIRISDMQDLRLYAARRVLRVYPLYLLTVVLAIAVGQTVVSTQNIIAEIFALRTLGYPYFSNPPAWSLYVEMAFYAVVPLYVFFVKKNIVAVSLFLFAALTLADASGPRELWLWKYFLVGIIASELSSRHGKTMSRYLMNAIFVFGVILLIIDFQGPRTDWFGKLRIAPWNPATMSIGLALSCGLILFATPRLSLVSRSLGWWPFRFLGIVSYSLFLLHPFVLLVVFPEYRFSAVGQPQEVFRNTPAVSAWYLPAVLGPATIFLAALSYMLVERPFLRRRPI